MHPAAEATWWCLPPTVNTAAMQQLALDIFARDEGIDAQHRVVLVLDGAGWHRSQQLRVSEGVDLVFLPPASPEPQPAERLWPLVNELVANRSFVDLDALEAVLVTRCQTLRADRPPIAGLTSYWWWLSDQADRTVNDKPDSVSLVWLD